MNGYASMAAAALVSLAASGAALAQQQSGQLGSGPPEDIFLEVTTGGEGGLTLSESEFHLAWDAFFLPEDLFHGRGLYAKASGGAGDVNLPE